MAVASARLLRVLAGLCGLLLVSVVLSVVDKASRKSLAAGPHQPHVLILRGGLVGWFKNPPHLHFDLQPSKDCNNLRLDIVSVTVTGHLEPSISVSY